MKQREALRQLCAESLGAYLFLTNKSDMLKKLLYGIFTILLIPQVVRAQEKPAFHITTITVSPEHNNHFKEQLGLLIDLFKKEKLGPSAMIATYRIGNKWSFVTLRPNNGLFGKIEPIIINALNDSTSIATYKKISESIAQVDLKADRKVIQQVIEWSYAPEGTPEHDRFAIIQEWNITPKKGEFNTLMRDIVTWAKNTEYPYVFDTYYSVEQPWKITFVTWVYSLDAYFQNHSIGALGNSNKEFSKLHDLLNKMLIDFELEVNTLMPAYSYLPQ